MKKTIVRILAVVFVLSLLSVSALAAETWGSMSVTASEKEVELGEKVTLTVYLGDCSDLEGGVKNYKAVVTVPEGLVVESATMNADFDKATGMINSMADVQGNVVTISSLGNVFGSYTGEKIAVATIVCAAEKAGSYEFGFSASLTDKNYASKVPSSITTSVTVVGPHVCEFGEWTVTTPATCETAGVETRTCTCGKSETREIPALGHAYGEWTVTTPATCETAGVETRVCANDEKHTETREIPALGHAWGEWTVTTEATCGVAGVETRVCANDKAHTETREIPATGKHTWTYKILDDYYHLKTCSVCGEEVKEAHEYDANNKCVCTHEKNEDLDPVPGTGDITPVVVTTALSMVAMIALAGYMLKRKFAV